MIWSAQAEYSVRGQNKLESVLKAVEVDANIAGRNYIFLVQLSSMKDI